MSSVRLVLFLAVGLAAICILLFSLKHQTGEAQKEPSPIQSTTQDGGTADSPVLYEVGSDMAESIDKQKDEIGVAENHSIDSASGGEDGMHSAVVRSWSGAFEPSLKTIIDRYEAGELNRFTIPTFDGESVTVLISGTRATKLGAATLTGKVEGEPGSMVTLATFENAEAGGILLPSRNTTFEIRPTADGRIFFNEVDVHALGECHICLAAARGDELQNRETSPLVEAVAFPIP